MPSTISATASAHDLISTLERSHGPLSFHFSGRVGGALLCLPAGELRIGGFDVLMGHYQGFPLYMRSDDALEWAGRNMLIAVTGGHTRGFSLEAGSGTRFILLQAPSEAAACSR